MMIFSGPSIFLEPIVCAAAICNSTFLVSVFPCMTHLFGPVDAFADDGVTR